MKVYENAQYIEDVHSVANIQLQWNKLKNNSILISGATGLIGSFLVDVIMAKNKLESLNCRVYALGRNVERARDRFGYCFNNDMFCFIPCDINMPLIHTDLKRIGYAIHLASNTHPVAYATDPIGTITTNIIGIKNILDFCVERDVERIAFVSSNEIYGENRGDVEKFDESYCGYIDCNTMRAGYSESKRCGEALCQAYISQKNMDIVIPRLTRSYGPTMLMDDTKAISQFIREGIFGEKIILKSAGHQYYSYTYVADAVSGLLTVLFCGEKGEAYNISDDASDIMLKDLAKMIAKIVKKSVVFEIPSSTESAGYSKATKARLDSTKIQMLGWKAMYDIASGVDRTIQILNNLKQN